MLSYHVIAKNLRLYANYINDGKHAQFFFWHIEHSKWITTQWVLKICLKKILQISSSLCSKLELETQVLLLKQ